MKRLRLKRNRSTRPRRASRAGTATVEFAFAASIIFFLFMAMIEFGRFHVVRHSIDQAVYMGARTGIIPGATTADVQAAVDDRLALAGVVGATVSITPSVITTSTESVTVRATADYGANAWAINKVLGSVQVVSEITLDHENVAFN